MATRTFNIDARNSAIEFAVVYATNSIVKGRFNDFSGRLDLDDSEPANSRVSMEIAAASVDTNNEERNDQLRGTEFLNAASYDQIRFESDSVDVVDDRHWKISGNLTIRGQSHPVMLDTRYYGVVTDPSGNVRAGLVGESELNRSTWSMDWNVDMDGGGVLFSDAVRVNVYLSAVAPDDGETPGVEESVEDAG